MKVLLSETRLRPKADYDDWERMNIPERYREVLLDLIPDLAHKTDLLNYINNMKTNLLEGKGLYLHGDYRSGKSCMAALMLEDACLKGASCYMVSEMHLPQLLWDSNSVHNKNIQHKILTCDLLVFDDLGMDRNVAYVLDFIEMLIRTRYNEKLSTIITSNLDLDKAKEKYGDSLVSVIKCFAKPVLVGGVNWSDILSRE